MSAGCSRAFTEAEAISFLTLSEKVTDWKLAVSASAHYTQKIIPLLYRHLLVKIKDCDLPTIDCPCPYCGRRRRCGPPAVQCHAVLFPAGPGRRRPGLRRIDK